MISARGTTGDIRSALAECRYYADDKEGWAPTDDDLEYVVDKLGYTPLARHWVDAGLEWVADTRFAITL